MEHITYRIGDIAKVCAGGDCPSVYCEYQTEETPIPIYSNGLDREGLYGYTNTARIEGDSITVSARGVNIGVAFYRPIPFFPIVRLISVVPKRKVVDAKYLYYYLRGVKIEGTGSAQPQIPVPFFKKKKIILHKDINTQKVIANILSAYDNLIENNNRRIRLLEQMAENLYKEWFVRFRFPGHEKVEFENGLPKGWKRAPLKTICEFERGKNITASEMIAGNVPVISAGISPSGTHNKSNVQGTSVTVSSSGANAGFISIHYEDIWAADCSYISEKSTKYIYYVYEVLNNMRAVVDNLQRGAAQPHVYPKDLNRITIIVPDENIQEMANEKYSQLHQLKAKLLQQNEYLSRQRDLLLPRLMSGKLEVKV